MKIVTWNCNLNFAKKYEHIEYMDADVCIIQECEKLNEDYFPNSKFFWTGRIEKKGLGILIKNGSACLDSSHNQDLINFLPIRSDNLKILGVWAYNHRAKKFGDNVSGETIKAIEGLNLKQHKPSLFKLLKNHSRKKEHPGKMERKFQSPRKIESF